MNEEEKSKCVLCGPQGLLAVVGILIGLVFIFMAIDVLTDSALSSAIGRRVEEVESADD